MDDMTEFLELHQIVHVHRLGLADPVDVVSGQIDQHDVLGSILLRCQKSLSELDVLCNLVSMAVGHDGPARPLTLSSLAPPDRSSDSVIVHLSPLNLAQRLWTGSNNLDIFAVEVEHVRTGVQPSEVSVDVEGVQLCRSRQSLTGDGLNDVALDNVLLQFRNETLIASFADIALRLVSQFDRFLLW